MGLDQYLLRNKDSQEPIIRWRKANQIHKWFVERCQNGEDDCNTYIVERDQLMKLLIKCRIVKRVPELGKILLPVTSGFFFGSLLYDEYYLEDIIYTEQQLTKLLKQDIKYYYYTSSW